MVTYDDIDFFGAAELVDAGSKGKFPQRVPESVRVQLNPGAQEQVQAVANMELRFYVEDDEVEIELAFDWDDTKIIPFWGSMRGEQYLVGGSQPSKTVLQYDTALDDLEPDFLASMPFAPRICRIVPQYWQRIYYLSINGAHRLPQPGEVPDTRILFYGTSITQGYSALTSYLTYPFQTGYRLNADVINLATASTCWCDTAMADYIASRSDWDAAVFSISVNMLQAGYSVDEFHQRAEYMVQQAHQAHPDKLIACVSLFPSYYDLSTRYRGVPRETADAYREALHDIVRQIHSPRVVFFRGPRLLDEPSGLSTALIHPSSLGDTLIAEHLARRLRPLLRLVPHGQPIDS